MNEFMTAEILGTFAGLVIAVNLIVQGTKSIVKKNFKDELVRLYAFIIALALIYVFAGNGIGVEGLILNIINAMLVTLTAFGNYELVDDIFTKGEDIDG